MKRAQPDPAPATPLKPHVLRCDGEDIEPIRYLPFFLFKIVQRREEPLAEGMPTGSTTTHRPKAEHTRHISLGLRFLRIYGSPSLQAKYTPRFSDGQVWKHLLHK